MILRFKAFGIHLAISLLILVLPLILATRHFYPGELFWGDGGFRVIQIALAVNVVLGPLLTLMVYVPRKKGLKFDLAAISVLQLAAFAFGAHAMYQERPVAIVFDGQYFSPVTRGQLVGDVSRFRKLGQLPLPIYGIVLPQDPKRRLELVSDLFSRGKPYYTMTKLWRPVDDEVLAKMEKAGVNPSQSGEVPASKTQEVADEMWSKVGEKKDYLLLGYQMRYYQALSLFNRRSKEIELVRLTEPAS